MDSGVSERQIGRALAQLASPGEPPAAGVAAALTGAQAASLVELSAGLVARRLGGEDNGSDPEAAARMAELAGRAAELREGLLEAADRDAAAYSEVAKAADVPARADALAGAADPPLAIAERAAETSEAAAEVAARAGAWAFSADAVVASGLAAAAARGAALLVSANLGSGSGDPRLARARDAAERAERSVPDRARNR
jgi:formiminotetrahydrofolate cyclodeaminase